MTKHKKIFGVSAESCRQHNEIMQRTITVYKPGDKGFDERAKKCTPPSEITVTHGMYRTFIHAERSTHCRHSYTSTWVVR